MRGKLFIGAASAALMLFGATAAAQDADPAGDTSTRARLTIGTPIEGAIDPQGEQDWYRVRVEEGQRYSFTLDAVPDEQGNAIDAFLVIYDTSGNVLTSNDDANRSFNSEAIFTPQATGDVIVAASTFADQGTGRYRLNATNSPAPADDAGNDGGTRARINAGASVNGVLEYEGDVDWYRLRASTSQRYRVNVTASGETPLSDTFLRVIDADGNEIAVNDDHEGLNSQVEFIPPRNGDVFIEASGYGGAQTGGYTVSVTGERAPADNAANSAETRARINVGQTVNGALEYTGDRDFFRIRLQEGQSYRFTLNSAGDTPVDDPFLMLHNDAGEMVAADDDGGDGFNSYLEFTAPSTGNYYLEARGFDEAATGTYALAARAGDIPGDATTDVSLNTSEGGDYREGMLSPAGDKDWCRVTLAEGESVRIGMTVDPMAPGALPDPLLVIYDAEGTQLATDDDGGEGLNSWLEFQAPAAGTYFVEARGFVEDAQGRYTLTLTPGEIGNGADGAEYLQPTNEPRSSVINTAGDVDWFVVELIEGRSYRFNVESGDPNPLADPILTLYNSEGTQIAQDDDGGAGLNSYLSYASPTGGPVFLAVSGFGDTTGRYNIRAVDTEVPGHVYTDEMLNATEDSRVSAIEMVGDKDNFSVILEQGARYVIEVTGEGEDPLADPFVAIVNEENTTVTSDDDSGDGRNARLRFAPETSALYYIQLSGLGRTTGGYKVSIVRQ